VRIASLTLLLMLSAAHAQDDDSLLETPPLGEGIPERVQELEREWAEDVGVKEPVDDPPDAVEPDVPAPADATDVDEPEPSRAPAVDEPRREPPSALGRPPGSEMGDRPRTERAPSDEAGSRKSDRGPSRAERRAISEE
jgi:hypothetical protein